MSNILLSVEGKRCTVSATDLELSIVTTFEANIENEGAITVPAKAILNFAQYNSDSEILLESVEGTQLRCTSKHAKTIISGESAGEYPTISPIQKEMSFTLKSIPLLEALNKVTFASAKTSLRPVLSGVYIRVEKGDLVLVATDSYRLSEFTLASTGDDAGELSCIVPAKVLEELKSILSSLKLSEPSGKKNKDGSEDESVEAQKVPTVEVTLSSQQIELRIGSTQLLSRLIEGKFPDYKQIIPKETKTTAAVSIKELTTIIKRMHYFAKEINNNLTFQIKDGAMHVSTPQTQIGKDEAELTAEVTGEENKIALSSSYLLDFLSHTEGDTVEIRVTDSMHPAVFTLPTRDEFLHLIMPLRIQDDQ